MTKSEIWSPEDLTHFKKMLEAQQERLYQLEKNLEKRALQELSASNVGEISVVRLHNADMASNGADQETALKIVERELNSIKKIERALVRLRNGKFGQCLICQKPILKTRLLASPEAEHCIDCQNNQEQYVQRKRRPHFADDPMVDKFELIN